MMTLAYEIPRVVFRRTLSVYERSFAFAETLAHLELKDRAERTEDGTVVYQTT